MRLPVFTDPATGKKSVSVTLVAITFSLVIGKWCLGGLSFRGHTFAAVSTAEIEAWLTPVFFLYFGRGLTKAGESVAMAKAGAKSDG